MANNNIVDSNEIKKSATEMQKYIKTINDTSVAMSKLSSVTGKYSKEINNHNTRQIKFDKQFYSQYSAPVVETDTDRHLRTVFNAAGLAGGKYGAVGKLYGNALFDEKYAVENKDRQDKLYLYQELEELNLKPNKSQQEVDDEELLRKANKKILEKEREKYKKEYALAEKKLQQATEPLVFSGEGYSGEDFIIEPNGENIENKRVAAIVARKRYERVNEQIKEYDDGLLSSYFNDSIKDVANIGRGDNSADDLSKINMLYIQQHGCVSELIRMKREEREEERLAREAAQEEEKRQAVNAGRKTAQNILDDRVSPIDKVAIDERNQLEAINQLQQNDPLGAEGLLFHRTYEDAKTAITEKASETRKAMMDQERQQDMVLINTGLGSMSTAANGMMDILEKSGKKQSNSYKVMFALSKSFAVAQASLSLYTAVMKAMGEANSMPERFANIAAAMASGVQFMSVIQGISMSGQAHAGIDYIPREGTWLLDRGERVVDSRTNADLKQYLNNSNRSSGGSSISVNVPLSVQSQDSGNRSASVEDANLLAGLIKSKVYEIVTNEQRPGGLLSRG